MSQIPNVRMQLSDVTRPLGSESAIAEIHANCIYRALAEMQLDEADLEKALGKILKELKSS